MSDSTIAKTDDIELTPNLPISRVFDQAHLAAVPSFGNKTFIENVNRADTAIKKIAPLDRVWNRGKTEWLWKHVNFSHYDDYGNLKQIAAELGNKKDALEGAKWDFLRAQAEIELKREEAEAEDHPIKRRLIDIEIAQMEDNHAKRMQSIEGALKDVLQIERVYDEIMERVGEFSEADFEKFEAEHHCRTAIAQSLQDIRGSGMIGKGNVEYLEYLGVNPSRVLQDLREFVAKEKERDLDGSWLADFIKQYSSQLVGFSESRAKVMGVPLGVDDSNLNTHNIESMTMIGDARGE